VLLGSGAFLPAPTASDAVATMNSFLRFASSLSSPALVPTTEVLKWPNCWCENLTKAGAVPRRGIPVEVHRIPTCSCVPMFLT
jgi:hypothetical protein